MRSITRASSAGSNQRQAGGLGRILPAALAALAATALLLLLAAGPARAAFTHVELGKFCEPTGIGTAPCEPTFAGRVVGATINQSTGDLLALEAVASTHEGRIVRFNSNGEPEPFALLGSNVIDGKEGADLTPEGGLILRNDGFSRLNYQVAVDESGGLTDGNIYVTQNTVSPGTVHAIDIFSSQGEYLGQLTEGGGEAFDGLLATCGVSVDGAGNVYVGSAESIYKFDPAGAVPTDADFVPGFQSPSEVDEPCRLAAGAGPSAGALYVVEYFSGPAFKLNAVSGAIQSVVDSEANGSVTVNPGNGNVFTGSEEYDSSGALVSNFGGSHPFAVEASSGHPFRGGGSSNSNFTVYSDLVPLPETSVAPASNVSETTAQINGLVKTFGEELEECQFQYLTEAEYQANPSGNRFQGAEEAPCDPDPEGIGTGDADVQADLVGLAAETSYRYRLTATNQYGSATSPEDEAFRTVGEPELLGQWAENVLLADATLKARINPHGVPTTYRFEWGLSGAPYENATADQPVGSDDSPHTVRLALSGLNPDTTYHFRAVAESNCRPDTEPALICAVEGADRTFTTHRPFAPDSDCPNQELRSGAAASLPDCRAYEMVSPIDKNGGDIVNGSNGASEHDAYIQATPDGEKIAYSAEPSFAGQLSARFYNQYIAARGDGGWDNSGINLPLGEQLPAVIRFEREVNAFSEDLCSMWTYDYNATPLKPDAQEGFNNLYRRDNCAPGVGSLETLTTAAPAAGTGQAYVSRDSVQGFSADGSAAFFVANSQLPTAPGTPAAATSNNDQAYLRLAGDPNLRLVSVLPSGLASGTKNAVGGGSERGRGGNVQNAVSADGTRVFWSAGVNNSAAGKLYLRLNPAQPEPTAKTIEVSAGAVATFWDATPTGSAALYSEGNLSGGTASLYRFDVATETRTKLAEKVYGLAGAGEDLSRIYLVSGVDHDGAGPAEENQPNLYLHEGGGFTFVGTLLPVDVRDTSSLGLGAAQANPFNRASRVTPDGRHIVFQSRALLTGFDNADAETGEASLEVFTHGAGGALRCVSCNPAGSRPRGRLLSRQYLYPFIGKNSEIHAAAWIPTWEHPLHASRVLSEDGNRIFFHSFDPLLPRDNNGTTQDLYQWEAPGTGSCDTGDADYFASNGGCLSLISSGDSSYETEFFDASADGSHVFFTTDSSLVEQDPGSIDLYDAHVNGGYPPPAEPASCEGEACQSPPPPPDAATRATAVHRGPGNLRQGNNCRRAAKRAVRMSRQAKRLRRRAKRVGRRGNPRAAKRLRRKSQNRARAAKRSSRAAKRCRRANRRAAR